MIDYTQYAFQKPVEVVDPLPSVADYLADYQAANQRWYSQWAYPQNEGWGPRPESFDVRGMWTKDLLPESVLPPVIRETQGDLSTGEYGLGSTTTLPEDQPVGQMVRDPAELSDQELWDTYATMTSPGMEYGSMVPGAVLGLATGVPGLGFMGRAGARDYANRIGLEMDRRITEALALGGALPSPAMALNPAIQLSRVGTPTVTDAGPTEGVVTQLATGPNVGGGMFQRVGDPSYRPEPEQRGGGDERDSYQGGEVGAGGWAGEGGL